MNTMYGTTKLLTFGQAADRLGIDVTQIRRWARAEMCPVIMDGRKRRIPAQWVEDLLSKGWRR